MTLAEPSFLQDDFLTTIRIRSYKSEGTTRVYISYLMIQICRDLTHLVAMAGLSLLLTTRRDDQQLIGRVQGDGVHT